MEDRSVVSKLGDDKTLYAVFDGHGGDSIAELCKVNCADVLKQCLLTTPHDVSIAIRECFDILDQLAEKTNQVTTGCTAVLCLVAQDRLWFANAGDSMTMVCFKNGQTELVSFEHKVEMEKERIRDAGALVTYWDGTARINGMLNVARGIGDFALKKYVPSTPFIRSINRKISDFEYILIASDGIWDVYTVESLHNDFQNFIRDNSRDNDRKVAIQMALTEIIRSAAMKGSTDNITIVYVDQT